MKKNQTLRFSCIGCITKLLMIVGIFSVNILNAQTVTEKIVQEENNHSQLKTLAHELFDKIGPRLVGTPQRL